MFPLRDDNPTLHTSFATFLIIGLNVASWIFIQGLGANPGLAASICKFGLIPGELLGTIPAGSEVPLGRGLVCMVDNHSSLLTILTSMFMHGGWLHILGNMWFLSIFGDNVEDAMGPVRFVLFYLLCGTAAAAAQIISNPSSPVPMVGASGAIGGVMGAYAVLYPRAPVHMIIFLGFLFFRVVVPAFFMLGYWFLLQFFEGLFSAGQPGVAVWAHIGGFLMGVFLVKRFCNNPRLAACRNKRGKTDRLFRRIISD